jgi:hypothetical protein
MEILTVFVAILFSMASGLGVGSSTLAVINFFVAIADGKIDETERHMMGVVYIVLRVAMLMLFVTLAFLTGYTTYKVGVDAFTPLLLAKWTILVILYSNAILMTMRIMPSTCGPAIQAGSWYSLGLIMALSSIQLTHFTYVQFVLCYISIMLLATAIINGVMAYLKAKREAKQPTTAQ